MEQCGNGARCFARFVLDKRLTAKRQIRVETKGGVIELDIRNDGQISVNMGAPRLVPADIPFQATEQALSYALDVDGKTVEIAAVSMGNPMQCCGSPTSITPRARTGAEDRTSPALSGTGQCGLLQVIDRNRAQLRVWERGVGETRLAAPVLAPLPWPRSARGGWIRRC